jgi:CheY-like chemotaxis protein
MHMQKKDKKILIVDDDPRILESVAALLEAEGYTVITANHPGLGAARAPFVDCIILDLQLSPGSKLQGGSVMNRIWEDAWCNTPIIVYSGMVGNAEIDETLKMIECVCGKGRNLFRSISKLDGVDPLIDAVNDWYETTRAAEHAAA